MTDAQASEVIRTGTIKEATRLVKEKLADESNPEWLVRGLVAIYKRQTADEQSSQMTKHNNSIGFNGLDAPILSSFAQQWQSRQWLSGKQLGLARRKMRKYAAQLVRVARGA